MAHVTCRLTAKDQDRLRKPPLGNRVWATFTCCPHTRLFRVCCPLYGRLTTRRRQDPNAGNSRFAEFRSKKYQNTISGTSSAASAVRRLPSAVRTATPAFHVRSSGLFCSRPGGLQLVTRLVYGYSSSQFNLPHSTCEIRHVTIRYDTIRSFSASPPYRSFSFFSFGIHYMDFPDCLLLLLSISVFFTFWFFCFCTFLVVGSVR